MLPQMRVLSNAALISAVAVATLAGSSLALAQPATQPAKPDEKAAATAPAVAKTAITTIAISGKASFKADEDASLVELKPGQALSEMSEIFTAPNSVVQIKVGEGQVFTIDHNSRVLIKDAMKPASGKETTTLQVPYGRVRFDITSTKVANDVKIQTPDATLAVKGTHGVIEKFPGQPTRAYGGQLNAGIFNVMYTSGIKVDVGKDKASSGDNPQIAAGADAKSHVKSNAASKNADTEDGVAGWTPSDGTMSEGDERVLNGQNSAFLLPHHGGANPLAGDTYVSIDPNLGTVISINSPNGATSVAGTGITGFLGTPQGSALVNTQYGPYLVAIDDNAGPNYASGTLALRFWNPGDRTWAFMGSLAPLSVWVTDSDGRGHFVESGYVLDGMGNLSGSLYASGVNPVASSDPNQSTGNYGIFQLTPPGQQRGAISARQLMSFPMLQSGGGLTGANSRGSMFAAARFNQTDGAQGLVLLEIDPRNNYIINAWSAIEGDFTTSTSTHITPTGATLPGGFQASGVSFAGGTVILSGTAGGQPTTLSVRIGNQNRPTATIATARVGAAGGATRSNASAGEGGFNASSPFPLGTPDRQYARIPGVDPLWLGAAYSRSAASSRTFRRMVTDTIFAHTPGAQAYVNSPAFVSAVSNAIADHYNQQDGVNAALTQFYNSFQFNHGGSTQGAFPVGR